MTKNISSDPCEASQKWSGQPHTVNDKSRAKKGSTKFTPTQTLKSIVVSTRFRKRSWDDISGSGTLSGIFRNPLRRFFGNHERWAVGVAAGDGGHHARIDHAQARDAAHLQA